MAKLLWLNWSGGGNLPPSLGIARVLTERGHRVAFAGRPEMVTRVQDAGFRAIELTSAYAQVDRYPETPLRRMACYLTSPAVGEQVRATIAAERPDALLVDAMFPCALDAACDFNGPSAVLFHHFFFRLREEWRGTGARLNAMRQQAGFEALADFESLWAQHDRLIVTTLAQFDVPADPEWPSVRHVGPVLEDEKYAVRIPLPWDASPGTPLALVSFSTAPEQRSLEKFQRTLDALAELPLHALVTTAGVVEIDELDIPHNVSVVRYAAHDPILREASVAITHGGHGTLMRALKFGVPMVVLPGLAHDQAPNARMVQDWGAGIALAGDADAAAIRDAVRTVLQTPSYRETAKALSHEIARGNGASNAADEIESLLRSGREVIEACR